MRREGPRCDSHLPRQPCLLLWATRDAESLGDEAEAPGRLARAAPGAAPPGGTVSGTRRLGWLPAGSPCPLGGTWRRNGLTPMTTDYLHTVYLFSPHTWVRRLPFQAERVAQLTNMAPK